MRSSQTPSHLTSSCPPFAESAQLQLAPCCCSSYVVPSFPASELARPSSSRLSLVSRLTSQLKLICSVRPTSSPQPEYPLTPAPTWPLVTRSLLSYLHRRQQYLKRLALFIHTVPVSPDENLPFQRPITGLPWPTVRSPSTEHPVQALCGCLAWVTVCPPRLARAEQAGWRGQGSPARLDSPEKAGKRGGKTQRTSPVGGWGGELWPALTLGRGTGAIRPAIWVQAVSCGTPPPPHFLLQCLGTDYGLLGPTG